MSIDQEVLDRMRELSDVMQQASQSVRQCEVTQKRVSEVVELMFTAYQRIDERIKAIEQRLDERDGYEWGQTE